MSDIPVRLAAVRADLGLDNIDALIVPRADEYLGEYVPEQNERLRWISGFAGSAGQVIVLRDRAAIFVDGRYTIQVRQQAPAECFEYRHLIDNPPVAWLCETLAAGARVGVDTRLHTNAGFESMQHQLAQNDIALVEISENFIDKHWHDRPQPQIKSAELLDERYTGEGSEAKRRRIGQLIATSAPAAAIN